MIELLTALGQYGALGIIAAVLLYMNSTHQKQMAERLSGLENKMMQIIENNTTAMTMLKQTLDNKPCLLERPNGCVGNNAQFLRVDR